MKNESSIPWNIVVFFLLTGLFLGALFVNLNYETSIEQAIKQTTFEWNGETYKVLRLPETPTYYTPERPCPAKQKP